MPGPGSYDKVNQKKNDNANNPLAADLPTVSLYGFPICDQDLSDDDQREYEKEASDNSNTPATEQIVTNTCEPINNAVPFVGRGGGIVFDRHENFIAPE